MIQPVSNRKPIHQLIDYRIFVVTCYHVDEYNAVKFDLLDAIGAQAIVDIKYSPKGKYVFIKYSIDEYVKSFNISRAIEGDPASLNIGVFPTKRFAKSGSYTFFYQRGFVTLPTFRRMDYIEIQVAEIHWTNDEELSRAKEIADFKKAIQYDTTAKDRYYKESVSKHYKVRFRGFVNEIQEEDTAEGGLQLTLQASSMLYYIANTPFISNLAMFSSTFFETQRSHILPNQYLVLFGNLFQDLRDTVSRTKTLLEVGFGVTSENTILERVTRKVSGVDKAYFNSYYFSKPATSYESMFNSILTELDNEDIKKTKTTQAALIPLAAMYYARVKNYFGNSSMYRLYSSQVFDTEIQFTGENTEFISNYTYLLQVLNQFKESIEYVLYEETDGTIVFDRPRYAEKPYMMIDEDEYTSYDYTETAIGYQTEVFATPGTALKILDDQIKETFFKTSGYTLDQLRRFGYRRPEPISNPNIMVPEAIEMYAKTKKAILNAALTTLHLSTYYDSRVELGKCILFRKKYLIGFVTDMSEHVEYGGPCTIDYDMSYLRRVIGTTGGVKIEKITIDNLKDILIEDFPEYTFASDFYGAQYRVADQTKDQNKKERSVS